MTLLVEFQNIRTLYTLVWISSGVGPRSHEDRSQAWDDPVTRSEVTPSVLLGGKSSSGSSRKSKSWRIQTRVIRIKNVHNSGQNKVHSYTWSVVLKAGENNASLASPQTKTCHIVATVIGIQNVRLRLIIIWIWRTWIPLSPNSWGRLAVNTSREREIKHAQETLIQDSAFVQSTLEIFWILSRLCVRATN